MARIQKPSSILNSLGEEIVRIIAPVSICMFLVVILVSILNSNSESTQVTSIASMVYDETSSDSTWDKFKGALLNSLAFVGVVTIATFGLVALFYFGCTKFLKLYMGFSAFMVLGVMGGEIAVFLIQDFNVPIDSITFLLLLFNFSIVGVLAVFMSKMAILVTQAYLVIIGMLVAYWFTLLPEWTTWSLLIAMSLYDLAAVLLPVGPLRILVELAISRDEDIPALVYEARPVTNDDSNPGEGVVQRRVWRDRGNVENTIPDRASESNTITNSISPVLSGQNNIGLIRAEEGQNNEELSAPLIQHRINIQPQLREEAENLVLEGMGLGSSGAIKLGLGDFIFYSVLVGRAAMYDFMTVYACYLAIIAGLGITLMLLALYQKALPALPVSVLLGVLFYFLTRYLLEIFIVQCSLNLMMF
ncbi:presenilin-like protein At2g29900 [Rutidosis leptorrhynchoides]|uniref:presenilin-like protein At2g29900 n=1 Tax=Rutidosis leptorrhynchoides TaxID=125765 RepID=UPI003A99DB50